MSVPEPAAQPQGWLERIAPLGAILFAVWALIAFLISPDTGDTAQEVIDSAHDSETGSIFAQVGALVTPILIGFFVATLATRMRALGDLVPRALTILGGTLFIAFFTVAITLWTAPLLEPDDLTTAGAEAYLAFDDAGWVLLGAAGVSAGVMIIGVSLAALRMRWVPSWLAWVSLALGIASFATVAFFGIFAWLVWFFVAGALMLWRGERVPAV